MYAALAKLVKDFRPDVAHFHNIWYLVSPSAFHACRNAAVPVVQTLHNFRIFCVNGLLMRNGSVCEDCLGRMPWRGALGRCFRQSFLYSLPLAAAQMFHRAGGAWRNCVDQYIALTDFARNKLIQGGLPAERVTVKPNFLPDPPAPRYAPGEHILFVGRLTPEKGAGVLVESVDRLVEGGLFGEKVKIVGDGAQRAALQSQAQHRGNGELIEFVGRKPHREVIELLEDAKFIVIPSTCYEMFPLACIEAFACGKPVVAARLGALAEIVRDGETGLLFQPGEAVDLARKMRFLLDNEEVRLEMGRRARAEFEAKYTAAQNYKMLMDIYRQAIEQSRGR